MNTQQGHNAEDDGQPEQGGDDRQPDDGRAEAGGGKPTGEKQAAVNREDDPPA